MHAKAHEQMRIITNMQGDDTDTEALERNVARVERASPSTWQWSLTWCIIDRIRLGQSRRGSPKISTSTGNWPALFHVIMVCPRSLRPTNLTAGAAASTSRASASKLCRTNMLPSRPHAVAALGCSN